MLKQCFYCGEDAITVNYRDEEICFDCKMDLLIQEFIGAGLPSKDVTEMLADKTYE